MPTEDLKDQRSHFAFGSNWASYSRLIGETEIREAQKALTKLVPADEIDGSSFLDIGCGSGLHALAALRLGARRVLAVDIDPDSVDTARQVLAKHATEGTYEVEHVSVFDLCPKEFGTFDIVYSWGVLHHTGDMWQAIDLAADMVAPGGLLVLALYRATRLDRLWTLEKRLYNRASEPIRAALRRGYVSAFGAAYRLTGRGSYSAFVKNYKSRRGMDFFHDVHDWMGGYPYETAHPDEVRKAAEQKGFRPVKANTRPTPVGVFGSGCNEYVFSRRTE